MRSLIYFIVHRWWWILFSLCGKSSTYLLYTINVVSRCFMFRMIVQHKEMWNCFFFFDFILFSFRRYGTLSYFFFVHVSYIELIGSMNSVISCDYKICIVFTLYFNSIYVSIFLLLFTVIIYLLNSEKLRIEYYTMFSVYHFCMKNNWIRYINEKFLYRD